MSNWLLTADVHINDYANYNYEHQSRLNQFKDLAHDLVRIGRENNCDTLVIAGDLLDRPINRPYVWMVADEFIHTIKQGFTRIYYIVGQHCVDAKSDTIKPEDTVLTIYNDDKFIYMDQQVITTPTGKRIGFKSWTPNMDLSWLEDKVDVLIAHYTKSAMFGQPIDEDKFDIMLHGDIHNDQEIGKFISIGNPIQHNMSSMKNGSVIVLDTDTCEWKRLRVDPNHEKYLRIDYTRHQEEEGFEGPLTYHIYRPPTSIVKTSEDSNKTDWSEIEELIQSLVLEKGLVEVHSEVRGKHPKYEEVDFDFKLKKIKLHGYRSIVDFELDLGQNERILLVGPNGSGKSSIVKGLKAAFESSRYISSEKSDFTEDLRVDIEFLYQNKLCHVWKGTNSWGMEIEGESIGYNNKTEFERDLVEKFPFLCYTDLLFITSNVSNLSNQFNPDRRIELLSKFYRLDRIEAYCTTAEALRTDLNTKMYEKKDELNRRSGELDNINRRISELSIYADKTEEDLRAPVDHYNQLLASNQSFITWTAQHRPLESQVAGLEHTLSELRKRTNLNVEETQSLLSTAKSVLVSIDNKINEVRSRGSRLEVLNNIRKSSYDEGIRLKGEIDSLESGVCPTCGSRVCNEHTQSKLEQYKSQLADAGKRFHDTDQEYATYTHQELTDPTYYVTAIHRLQQARSEKEQEIRLYETKLTQYEIAKSNYDSENKRYEEAVESLRIHLLSKPEQVVLPPNIQELIINATSEYNKWQDYQNEVQHKEDKEVEISYIKSTMSDIQNKIDRYTSYISLMNRSGEVMEAILRKMAESFSDSTVKYEVDAGVYRNKPYIKFNAYYKVKNKWRIYETLSDGQKTISDLDFLNKLFSVRVGLLVLDETLKHLDFINGPIGWELINKMNVNTVLISTHDANYATYTKKINLELDPNGATTATII